MADLAVRTLCPLFFGDLLGSSAGPQVVTRHKMQQNKPQRAGNSKLFIDDPSAEVYPLKSNRICGTGFWQLAIGHWSLAIGHWPLATGYWLLVTGHWPLDQCGWVANVWGIVHCNIHLLRPRTGSFLPPQTVCGPPPPRYFSRFVQLNRAHGRLKSSPELMLFSVLYFNSDFAQIFAENN
jgi:hypothetical protein